MREIVQSIAEIACSEVSSNAIDEISKKTKIPPFHIVSHIEGLAHDHPPCDYEVESCMYCRRNGNIFSNVETKQTRDIAMSTDIISKYKSRVVSILEELYNEISYISNKKIVNEFHDVEQFESDESDDDFEEEYEYEEKAPKKIQPAKTNTATEEIDLDKMLANAFGLSCM